ncbi:MAG: hypothetical protein AVDCRST_MAG83-3568, partial [uncultured Arthrobacter sp.]
CTKEHCWKTPAGQQNCGRRHPAPQRSGRFPSAIRPGAATGPRRFAPLHPVEQHRTVPADCADLFF